MNVLSAETNKLEFGMETETGIGFLAHFFPLLPSSTYIDTFEHKKYISNKKYQFFFLLRRIMCAEIPHTRNLCKPAGVFYRFNSPNTKWQWQWRYMARREYNRCVFLLHFDISLSWDAWNMRSIIHIVFLSETRAQSHHIEHFVLVSMFYCGINSTKKYNFIFQLLMISHKNTIDWYCHVEQNSTEQNRTENG